MFDYPLFLSHSGLFVALATIFLLFLVLYNPRLMLQDYPPAIKEIVPPKTEQEKRLSTWLGLPFILVLFIFPVYATFLFQARTGGRCGFPVIVAVCLRDRLCLQPVGLAGAGLAGLLHHHAQTVRHPRQRGTPGL
jgi:hypothetical protein